MLRSPTRTTPSGLFAPHEADLSGLNLPVAWKDDMFVPFDWGWFAFVYDSERLPHPPESLAALVDNPDGPTVIIEFAPQRSEMHLHSMYRDPTNDYGKKFSGK